MPRKPAPPRLDRDRKRPKDGNWYIYWTEGGRSREYSTGTTDREEAELSFAEWKLNRVQPSRAADPFSFYVTDAVAYYLNKNAESVADPERLANAAKPIIAFFNGYSVGEVTRALALEYYQKRRFSRKKKPLKDNTIRRELGFLSTAIRFAKDENLISSSVKIWLPPKEEGRTRFLSCEEALRLIRVSRDFTATKVDGLVTETKTEHLTLFIRIALRTGRRKEAILSLKWTDIDFESGIIYWNPVGRKRTKKERPTAQIPQKLIKHLRQRQRRFPNDEFVFTHRGKPIQNIKRAFKTAVIAAGLQTEGDRKVTPHTLRHTCATWQMQKGNDKYEVAGFLGMSSETLERHYGHHHPDHQKGAANAF